MLERSSEQDQWIIFIRNTILRVLERYEFKTGWSSEIVESLSRTLDQRKTKIEIWVLKKIRGAAMQLIDPKLQSAWKKSIWASRNPCHKLSHQTEKFSVACESNLGLQKDQNWELDSKKNSGCSDAIDWSKTSIRSKKECLSSKKSLSQNVPID